MRIVALVFVLVSSVAAAQPQTVRSRLNLPLENRLDASQVVVSASLSLRDFVGFIATSFKVPLLVETPSPVPDLKIPAGSFSARQLLDIAVGQMRGFEWRDEAGVAHLYNRSIEQSAGNILNVRIHRFYFPHNVAEFLYFFRPCVHGTIQGYSCEGGAYSGFMPDDLKREPLPYLEAFKDVPARQVLLRALQANGRFYVLIAYEGTRPQLKSEFAFRNWFSQSLVPAEPAPIWIERPNAVPR
jgi:hypothetical protein